MSNLITILFHAFCVGVIALCACVIAFVWGIWWLEYQDWKEKKRDAESMKTTHQKVKK